MATPDELKMGDAGTVTELTTGGLVTRMQTAQDKRNDARWKREHQKQEASKKAARAWLDAFLDELGLTPDDVRRVMATPYTAPSPERVAFLKRLKGSDRARFEWLLRHRVLVELEISVRYWAVGKGLRQKVLTAINRTGALLEQEG
jgi:hypothetical protein